MQHARFPSLLAVLVLSTAANALDWHAGPGHRAAKLAVPAGGKTGFTLLDPATLGIDFTNDLSETRLGQFQNLMNGSGVAAADIDGDGHVDLYFVHKQSSNQLFRNLGGWKFANVTAGSGAGCTNQTSVGAVFGDLDGNGTLDLLVTGFGGPHACLLNDGKGRFTDVAASCGIASRTGGTSLALADVDGDGDLDLYQCNFATQAILRDGATVATRMVDGQPVVTGRFANRLRIIEGKLYELGEPDVLYLNDGKGRFTPTAWEKTFSDAEGRPVPPAADFGLAVQIRDVDGDGFPDIYVCDDFQTPDHLWLGDGKGRFREAPAMALRNMSFASMGVDFADIDRDGRLDLFTVEMLDGNLGQHLRTSSPISPIARSPGLSAAREEFPRNALYWNRGDGTYAEIACFAGVAATSWSWAPVFIDVDLDGWEDLLVSNGHMHDVNNRDVTARVKSRPGQSLQVTKDLLQQYPRLEPPKAAFRNQHDLTFADTSAAWGFDSTRIAHGMVTADLDEDGDLDLVLNCAYGPPLIYRNDTSAPRVAVRLKGKAPNGTGIGARITLTGGPVRQSQEMVAGGQYLSSSEPLRVFAAGKGDMTLEVVWRSGQRSVVEGVKPDFIYEVDETGAGAPVTGAAPATKPATWYADDTAKLDHVAFEEPFDDFAQQPTLPYRLGQLGPSVLIADVDGDGRADVVVGGSRGGRLAVKLGNGKGGFKDLAVPGPLLPDDLLGLVTFAGAGGRRSILAALANYESADTNQPSVLRWDLVDGALRAGTPVPSLGSSPGAIAIGDLEGDGRTGLFVGGRVNPRRWPEPAVSKIFREQGGRFIEDVEASRALADVGLVTGAVFADLDGDRRPELILSTDHGPIRVFRSQGGGLREVTKDLGLDRITGRWNCIATADLDGDGKIDLVAGNWGRNSASQVWGDGMPGVWWGDLAGDGTVGVVEAVRVGDRDMPSRDRDYLAAALPDLAARFPSHSAYAAATVRQVLGEHAAAAKHLAVSTLETTVFLNRGSRFEARALPAEAQWAPVHSIAFADADGDGIPDLFLAQNQFAVRPEDSRIDAGRGLWLRGDGKGAFVAVPGQESGVVVYGEQRGAAAGDLDGDGRPDLVVTQNGSTTRLFRNIGVRAKR